MMMNPKYFLLLLILPFVFWGGCEDKKAAPDCTELATEAAEALATYVMAALEGPATPECEAANSAVQAVIDGGCDIVDEDPANGTGDLEDSQGDLPCAGDGDGGDGGDGDDGEDYGDGECTSDADCVDHYGPGWTCEGEDWMTSCTEGEGGCTSDADCQEGEFCLEGECMI